jgi:hypothetical protein
MNETNKIGFEEAIERTNRLLKQIENHGIDDQDAEKEVALIVSTLPGARGFLVSYLTGDFGIVEEHPEPIVKGLKKAPSIVGDLVSKNIVMSSTMALTHGRNGAVSHRAGSQRVTRRSQSLSNRIANAEMMRSLALMSTALEKTILNGDEAISQENAGEECADYISFLKRWKYDLEQLQCAQAAIALALKNM